MFQVGQIVAPMTADLSGFSKSMASAKLQGEKAADSISKSFRGVGKRMQAVGSAMTAGLTAPILGIGAASTKAFATFDSEMTKSLAIMDGVTSEMRTQMEDAAMSMSEDLNMSASKAAESYFFLASAGLDAEQSVAALPKVAQFAKAGMFDMATATDLATDAQSALGLTVEDAAKNMQNLQSVTDTLVKANTLANASVQQFADALTNRAAAALRTANKDMEQGVAVLAAFADQGIKGARAGEQLSRILRLVAQGAAQNTEEFKRIGLVDAQGNMKSLAQIVEVLTGELSGLSDSQKSARLEQLGFTARVQQSIKPLLGLSDQIREYESELRNAGGTTEDVANNQMKAFSEQLGQTWQMIRNAGIEIGKTLAPAIRSLNEDIQPAIKGITNAFKNMSESATTQLLSLVGILGASGPIIAALGTLSLAIGAISAPIAGVVAAIAAGGAAIVSNWDDVTAYFTTGDGAKMWEDFKGIISEFKTTAIALWEAFGDQIISITKSTFGLAIEIVERSLGGILEIMKKFNGNFDSELDVFEDNWLTTLNKIDGKITDFTTSAIKKLAQTFNIIDTEYDRIVNDFEKRDLKFDFGLVFSDEERESALSFLAKVKSMEARASVSIETPKDVVIPAKIDLQMPDIGGRDLFKANIDGVNRLKDSLTEVATVSLDTASKFASNLKNMTASGAKFASATEAALYDGTTAFQEFTNKAKAAGFDFVRFISGQVASAITSFSKTVGKMFAGTANEWATGFEKLILLVTDFAKQLGQLLIGIGSAIAVIPGLQGNAAAFIAGGSALTAIATGVASGIKKRMENRRERAQEESVNDALITSAGKIVKFSASDNILAMKDFSALGQKMGGGRMSQRSMQKAFQNAIRAETQKLGPQEIYAMNAKGSRGF